MRALKELELVTAKTTPNKNRIWLIKAVIVGIIVAIVAIIL